jgi:hypothetical protein
MNHDYFFAQDLAGNAQKVHVLRRAAKTAGGGDAHGAAYALEDGSVVERVDSDTFRVVGTGAYITLLRE